MDSSYGLKRISGDLAVVAVGKGEGCNLDGSEESGTDDSLLLFAPNSWCFWGIDL